MGLIALLRSAFAWVAPGRPSLRSHVERRVWLGEDAMELRISGCEHWTEEALGEAMSELGVEVEPEWVRDCLAAGRDGVLLRGRAAVPGTPGRIRFLVELGLSTGRVQQDGGIDWRDRGYGAADVAPGDLVARLELSRSGVEGVDLLGRILPVDAVEEAWLNAGRGIERAGDRFVATVAGRVSLEGGTLSVVPVESIPGDIGYETGHVSLPTFGADIAGDVTPGFEVDAGGPIEVHGVVDNGTLISRSNITVHGGIVSRGPGGAWSCGPVHIGHGSGATIRSVGDVTTAGALLNCDVSTAGDVVARKIVGGSVRAGGSIRVQEAGSPGGAETLLVVGAFHEALAQIAERVEDLEARLHRLGVQVGSEALPMEGAALRRMIAALQQEAAVIRADPRHHERAEVRVDGRVHAGVVVCMGDALYRVHEPRGRTLFRLVDGEIQV